MDAVLKQALETVDADAREELLQAASQMVMEDYGVLPLHFQRYAWVMRSEIDYLPRADGQTLAFGARLRENGIPPFECTEACPLNEYTGECECPDE